MSGLVLEEWSEDIGCLRLPMTAFGGVNALIVGPPGQQAIIDTGMPGPETAAIWDAAFAERLVRGVDTVLCTHMHIDHVGQTGSLLARTGARLLMSPPEHEDATLLAGMTLAQRSEVARRFHEQGGFAATAMAQPTDYAQIAPFPPRYEALQPGQAIELGGIAFEVLLGGGHSRAAVCLVSWERGLLIAGDQFLGGSGPQIPVQAERPEDDMLGPYLAFLDRLGELTDDFVILPGHGGPIADFKPQLARIRDGHLSRLDRLLGSLDRPATCREMAPLLFSGPISALLARRLPYLIRALANHLVSRGELTFADDADGVRHFARAR